METSLMFYQSEHEHRLCSAAMRSKQESTEALYSLTATTKSHRQGCPCWQTLFPLGSVYRTNLLNMYGTPLARADACMEAQVTLVWNNAQQSGTFCSWAMLNTALLFTGHFLWLVQLPPKTHSNRRAQLIKLLWVAPAVLSNARLLLLSKTGERNAKELSQTGL